MKKLFLMIAFSALCQTLPAQTNTGSTRQESERDVVNDFWNGLGKTFEEPKPANKAGENSKTAAPVATTPTPPLPVASKADPEEGPCTLAGMQKELDGSSWYLRSAEQKGWIKLNVDSHARFTGSFVYGPVEKDEKSNVYGTIGGQAEVVRGADGECHFLLRCVWKAQDGIEETHDLRIKPGSNIIGTMDATKKPWGGIRI